MLKVSQIFQVPFYSVGSDVNAITRLLLNPFHPQQIISIDHDGYIKTYDISTLKQLSRKHMKAPYLTSIIPIENGFLLGIGNGKLLHLNPDFNIIKQCKIHQDCLTDIIELPDSYVTTSFDGKITFLNKSSLQIQKQISFQTPLLRIVYFKGDLYLAGNPSYRLNLHNFEVEEIGKYQNFVIFQDEIFGSCEEIGLTRLKNNQRAFQPCQFVFSGKHSLMMVSGESLGFLTLDSHNYQMKWKVHKIVDLDKHFSVCAALQHGDYLFLANQSSKILRLTLVHQCDE